MTDASRHGRRKAGGVTAIEIDAVREALEQGDPAAEQRLAGLWRRLQEVLIPMTSELVDHAADDCLAVLDALEGLTVLLERERQAVGQQLGALAIRARVGEAYRRARDG